jgi:Sec-independent protein translocase protein TatA
MARAVNKKAPAVASTANRAAGEVRKAANDASGRFRDALAIAEETGLLKGARTELVRGRMPKALVARAKARTGVQSDTKLIEVALATLAVADEYPDWLISQRGTVSKDLDLEF